MFKAERALCLRRNDSGNIRDRFCPAFYGKHTVQCILCRRKEKIYDFTATALRDNLAEHIIRGEWIRPADGTFSGLYVLSGTGQIGTQPVQPGSTFFVPAAHDAFSLRSDLEMRVMEWFGPKRTKKHTN